MFFEYQNIGSLTDYFLNHHRPRLEQLLGTGSGTLQATNAVKRNAIVLEQETGTGVAEKITNRVFLPAKTLYSEEVWGNR